MPQSSKSLSLRHWGLGDGGEERGRGGAHQGETPATTTASSS